MSRIRVMSVGRWAVAVPPSPMNLGITFALQLQALCVYLIFVAPLYSSILGICVAFIFAVNTYFLLRAALSEPGILPFHAAPVSVSVDSFDYTGDETQRSESEHKVLAQESGTRCVTCLIERPPRSKHCRVCDCCISEMDHHCPWMGTCIGRRNYRWFCFYVFTAALGLSIVLIQCYYQASLVWPRDPSVDGLFRQAPALAWLCVFCSVAFLGEFLLLLLHSYLISTGKTTNEFWKLCQGVNPYGPEGLRSSSPYNQGCWLNFKRVFLTPVPASKVEFPASSLLHRPR